MTKQSEVAKKIEDLIPAELWEQYGHLSYAEMAEIDELEEWADELNQAESDWFEAEDA